MLHGPKPTQSLAAELRRTMTLPELVLWRALQTRPGGLRFRRQHPAGRYVLDFFCPRARLAMEVDGEAHGRGDRPARDETRDDWVAAQGVRTLRIPARAVLTDLNAVIRHIVAEAKPHSSPGGGGGTPKA
jgi:very-short-patch-repair endonuclease